MRLLVFTAIITASLVTGSSLKADDGLFSEVAMESVFGTSKTEATSVATKAIPDNLERITSVSSLVTALEKAGFDASQVNGKAKIYLNSGTWKLPVTLGVHVDQDRIVCEMSLRKLSGDQSIEKQNLFDLLSAGNSVEGMFFALDQETKVLQLRSSMSNRMVTDSLLKTKMLRLASMADNHADFWAKKEVSQSVTTTLPTESVSVNPKREAKSSHLEGSWAATLEGGDVFAIQITPESRFNLVHLKAGKPTISKGKAIRLGSQLKLVGDDGITLNCRVSQTAADQFRLEIQDSNGNVAATLDFKKAA